jgi:hypothetical protein
MVSAAQLVSVKLTLQGEKHEIDVPVEGVIRSNGSCSFETLRDVVYNAAAMWPHQECHRALHICVFHLAFQLIACFITWSMGENHKSAANADTLLAALKTLKGRTMAIINEALAKSKEEEHEKEADALLEEPKDESDVSEDEIQKIAGDTSHKKKKRKTGL